MSKIKSYLVHLSPVYKIIMTIIPIVLLLLQLTSWMVLQLDILPFILGILCFADVFSDYFCFGGIYSKEGKVQSFYKISPRGKQVYLNVFIMHGIKRGLLYFGFALISTLMGLLLTNGEETLLMAGGTWAGYFLAVLIETFGAYAYSVVACFACRKFDMLNITFAFAMWGFTVMTFLNLARMFASVNTKIIILAVVIVIALAGTVLLMWYNRKKMEDSYYDEKSFKRNQSGI